MTKTWLSPRTLSIVLNLLLISAYGTSQAQPTSGDWKATTTFGELAFTVNPTGTKITKLIRDVRNWACGPVSGSWTTTSYYTDPTAGWPITNSQFNIILSGSMGSLATVWSVTGTFGSTGKEASGTWAFNISGTTCSGNWGPVSPVVSVDDDARFPGQFALMQNYPNPFNPRTVVSAQWPVVSNVKLVIYDVLGREVAILVDEQKPAGRYEFEFDASGLASGLYVCRLTAGEFVASRKMLLAK
jgi:hypothetical protein